MKLRTQIFIGCLAVHPLLWGCKATPKNSSSNEEPAATAQAVEMLAQKPDEFPTAPLGVGATVFDFAALAHTGQALKLSDFLRRPSVVYFCAQDKAPVCTSLATSLRDNWSDLHAQVDMVFGVSAEPSIVHDDFASENKLPFLLLTDPDNTLHRVFGIQPGSVVSYLIGTDRKILQVFAAPNTRAHAGEIVSALTALGLKREDYPM